MSEHKSVVIDIEETEKSQLGEFSELESIETSGVLTVHNVSERVRIWNVRVLLGDSRDGTDIEEEDLMAGEIDAGQKWEQAYSVDTDAPVLTLTEVYDTCAEVQSDEPHWAYVSGKDNRIRIILTIKNETDVQFESVVLNKAVPPEIAEIDIESAKSGVAEFDEGTRQIVWKDLVLYPNEDSTLVLVATARADDVEIKKAGEVVVTYKAEGLKRSVLTPDMTALTEFLAGIETSETQPNHWECILECSNESDIMVRLDKADVYLTPPDGSEKELKIDEAPAKELAPGEEWSAKFEVDSSSPPICTHEITYTATNTVKQRVVGTIKKTPQPIPVMSISYEKDFDPPEVASFDKTPVEVTIEILNNGTAKLNDFKIVDKVPDDVMPPKKEHIAIWVRGEEYSGPFEMTIDPDDQDPEKAHTLTFEMNNLRETVGELAPGESLKVNYAIMAWRSRPEKEYPSPIACYANIHPRGVDVETVSTDDAHKIAVVYKKRRLSVKKAINKGANPGEYIVLLVIENKGEVTVENVEVTDWLPSGFEYLSVDQSEEAPSVVPVEDGSNLVWNWTRMSPGDKMTIHVTVQGEGEYERREPEITSD